MYVAVDKTPGKAVWEFWSKSIIAKINTSKYTVMSIHDYLVSINGQVKKKEGEAIDLLRKPML